MCRLTEIGLPARQALLPILALALALGACGGEEPPSAPNPPPGPNPTPNPPPGPNPTPNPQTGLIQVSTATTGADLDPNGYSAAIDGNSGRSIGLNGVITFTDVAEGSHQVELTGLAANCSVTGANPATVAVTADATAQAAFAVTCVATSGSIDITTVTTGSFLDPNNYSVSVDAGQSQTIGINATVTLTAVAAGARSVELSDVAGNCTVGGTNPTTATVSPGATVQVSFDVICVSPTPGTIAFLSLRGGSPQLEVFVTDGAGAVVTQVTQTATEKWEPLARLSPDGTKILFPAGVNGQRDLWVVNTDGTGLFNLTNSAEDEDGFLARWSPDGTQVAYLHHFVRGIWVISASGGVPVLLTGLWTYSLDWSPDGSKIAFTAAPNGPQVSDGAVYVINSDGSGLQQLTNLTFLEFDVAWSPDGSKIVFAHSSGGPVNIFIMNADGTGLTQLTVGNSASRPRWSPNGSKIAFSSQGLWVMNPDGSGQQKISDLHVHQWPEWSPDGSTIAFTSGPPANTEVYTIRPDGSGLSNISNDPAPDYLGSWGP